MDQVPPYIVYSLMAIQALGIPLIGVVAKQLSGIWKELREIRRDVKQDIDSVRAEQKDQGERIARLEAVQAA